MKATRSAFVTPAGSFLLSHAQRCISSRPRLFTCTPLHGHSTLPTTRISASITDTLVLTEENIFVALAEVKEKLGSVFGNNVENRDVGITGDVELASLDGPTVVLRLRGRFWHKRADVLARVSAYLETRIPEICDVSIEDERQLEDTEEESNRL